MNKKNKAIFLSSLIIGVLTLDNCQIVYVNTNK